MKPNGDQKKSLVVASRNTQLTATNPKASKIYNMKTTTTTKTIWLNKVLGHRIEITEIGFRLINEYGYVGTFRKLCDAYAANVSREP